MFCFAVEPGVVHYVTFYAGIAIHDGLIVLRKLPVIVCIGGKIVLLFIR